MFTIVESCAWKLGIFIRPTSWTRKKIRTTDDWCKVPSLSSDKVTGLFQSILNLNNRISKHYLEFRSASLKRMFAANQRNDWSLTHLHANYPRRVSVCILKIIAFTIVLTLGLDTLKCFDRCILWNLIWKNRKLRNIITNIHYIPQITSQ